MSITTTSTSVIPPYWLPLTTGRLYSTSLAIGAVTTVAMVSNTLYATPIFTPKSVTLTNIGVEVTSGSASTNARLGIYYDSTGVPGNLLTDAGTISGASATYASVATSQVLTPGWWWLSIVCSVAITVRALTTANSLHLLGFSSGTDVTVHTGVQSVFNYATLPNPFPASPALTTTNFPRVMIQV